MRIGLVADSQGDLDALEWACDLLIEEKGATRIFFLGGRWGDLDDLVQKRREDARGGVEYSDQHFLADVAAFVAKADAERSGGVAHRLKQEGVEAFVGRFARVPDKDCLQYRDPAVARVLTDMVGDRIATLVHDKADLKREDIEPASYLLHACSPTPEVVQIGHRYFITPGSLSGSRDRTCGLIAQGEEGTEFVAFGLDGGEVKRAPLIFSTRRTLTVK